jgi:hypothetical protein
MALIQFSARSRLSVAVQEWMQGTVMMVVLEAAVAL